MKLQRLRQEHAQSDIISKMSIQDESFPNDDDLQFSQESAKNFVFSHHKPRRNNNNNVISNNNANSDERELAVKANNISSSSPLENQGDFTHSSNEFCLSSETSGKTNASEPNDLQVSENKKLQFVRNNTSKSISYLDIHSEYTKRRYKHVESKVGQYIANMRAQDERRRKIVSFQRHSSMPETLHGRETTSAEMNNDGKKLGLLRCSTNDLDRLDNNHNELQNDRYSYNYNYDNLTTTTTSSLSTKDLVSSETGIVLDKQTYEQLLSEKDRNEYLETKLEEKNVENWRLKQNLDTIRIEYSLFKDKLKQQTQVQRLSDLFGSKNTAATVGSTILYSQETREKSTQTDNILTPSPIPAENKTNEDMYATPLIDSNNNAFDHAAIGVMAPVVQKVSISIATIQPLSLNFSNLVDQDMSNSNLNTTMGFLRQRSNSLAARKKSTPLATNVSKTSSSESSVPSSSDSAIDIEVTESPKTQRQKHREEFVYFEQHSQQRGAVVNARDADSGPNLLDTTCHNNSNINNTMSDCGLVNNNVGRNRRKRYNLRSRVMRFFGVCTKCDDTNISLEAFDSQHSQIPLLEKRLNYCHNVR